MQKFTHGGYITLLIGGMMFHCDVYMVPSQENQKPVCGICTAGTLYSQDTGAE